MSTIKHGAETGRLRFAPKTSGIGRGPLLPVPPTMEPHAMTRPEYIDGEIDGLIVKPIKAYHDDRGWLMELFRHDELAEPLRPVMAYASMTLPGVARGPHEHRDQTDGFAFFGPSDFRLYAWDLREGGPTYLHRMSIVVGESRPAAIWIPPGIVHAYRNIGDVPGLVFNAPNRLYAGWNRAEPVDEIRHETADPERFPLD